MNGWGEGEGYRPEELKYAGKLLDEDLYRTFIDTIVDFSHEEGAVDVRLGKCWPVGKNDIAVTYGANPCVAGVAIFEDSSMRVFHSAGDLLTEEMVQAINQSKGGLVGGGIGTLRMYMELLVQKGFHIKPDRRGEGFAIAVVTRDIIDIPRGIYYGLKRSSPR